MSQYFPLLFYWSFDQTILANIRERKKKKEMLKVTDAKLLNGSVNIEIQTRYGDS